jgi:alpha-glucosidase
MFRFMFLLLLLPLLAGAQKRAVSPDKNLAVTITGGKSLMISATFKGQVLLEPSEVALVLMSRPLSWDIARSSVKQIDARIVPPVAEKRKEIRDYCTEMTVTFRSPVSLQVRVYDDGFAYRFISSIKDSIVVENEIARYSLPDTTLLYGSPVTERDDRDIFHTSFEEPYVIQSTDTVSPKSLFFSPVLVGYAKGAKASITESDLEDYPGMFLRVDSGRVMTGVYAGYPIELKMIEGEFPQEIVTRRADYIARTKGTRSFPWRVFMISAQDKQLPSNDMVYRLGAPARVTDTNWIKPGKGTDEWIIGVNLFNVPFKTGVNTATYKYYIDFARRFGFQRIMMDAGWSDYKDLFKINPAINMDEISAYAKAKGISLSMWTLASTLERQLDPALKQFRNWGVDFIMTDFMDRDDQLMVNFYHRIAKACADHQIMIMYHGAFKGAGFSRTWPNSITREGVLGSEYNIWSTKANPDHDLLLPYIRMTAGPMDYEPGILDNATKTTFRPIQEKVMSMGTRMHQAAMFVVYESPIQLFSGNPAQGYQEPEFMELVGRIPTVWDETIVLDGKVGEYIVTARKKDGNWYIGGMTNWTGRKVEIDFSFLGDVVYDVIVATDGVNADRYPSDHVITKRTMTKHDRQSFEMAKGGGFVLILNIKR